MCKETLLSIGGQLVNEEKWLSPSTQCSLDHVWNAVQFWSQSNTGKTMINRSSAEGHRDVWGLEHQPCEERLRNQGEGTASGALNSSLGAHGVGNYWEVRAGLLTALHGWRARDNRLKSRELQSAYKEKFPPTPRSEMHWNGAQRGCAVSSLRFFQDTTGSSPAQPGPTSQLVRLLAGGRTRDLSYSMIFSHTEKGLFDVSLRGCHVTSAGVSFIPFQCKEDVFFPKAQKLFYSHNPRKKIKRQI